MYKLQISTKKLISYKVHQEIVLNTNYESDAYEELIKQARKIVKRLSMYNKFAVLESNRTDLSGTIVVITGHEIYFDLKEM